MAQNLSIAFVDVVGTAKLAANGSVLALDDSLLRKTWPDPEDTPIAVRSDGLTPPQEFRRAFERMRNGKEFFVDGIESVLALHEADGWATAMEAGISPEVQRPMAAEMREALDALVAVLPAPARLRRGALPSNELPYSQPSGEASK